MDAILENPHVEDGLERSSKTKKVSVKLKDYVNIVWHSPTKSHSSPAPSIKCLYFLTNYVTCDKFSNKHRYFLASIIAESELVRYFDAVSNPKWREAMQKEITTFDQNDTWE